MSPRHPGPHEKGGVRAGDCVGCVFRKISSTLLLEAAEFEKHQIQICGQFPQRFKYILVREIRKYQRIGLKSIEIKNISTDEKSNLIIDFDLLVNPKYNALIRRALRRAIITLDVSFIVLLM